MRTLRQKSGMVMLTVLMVIMVMSIFATSILSQSMNQGFSSKAQLDRIVATQLAKGAFWKVHSDMMVLGVANPTVGAESLNGKTFTVTADARGTAPYTLRVNY